MKLALFDPASRGFIFDQRGKLITTDAWFPPAIAAGQRWRPINSDRPYSALEGVTIVDDVNE